MIDWTRKQYRGFENLIHTCSQRGRFCPTDIYSNLKSTANCIFHETAGYFMKFMLSAVRDFKVKFSKLELHYMSQELLQPLPKYSRDPPNLSKYSKGTQNNGNISSENTSILVKNK